MKVFTNSGTVQSYPNCKIKVTDGVLYIYRELYAGRTEALAAYPLTSVEMWTP